MSRERELLRMAEIELRTSAWRMSKDLANTIRALLDEPEREVEYVWRAVARDPFLIYTEPTTHMSDALDNAAWWRHTYGTPVVAERAPIGKWEAVE